MVRAWQNAFDLARTSDTVFICAMHGKTIGGAIDLCTGADIRVCDKSAAFSVAEVKLAIVADLGTLQRLGRVVGHGRARHWALTGEFVGSEEALQAGLVTKVYEDYAAMMKGVRTMAHSIATYSPRVLKGIKSTLNYSEDHSVQEGLEYVAHYNSHSLCEEDVAEATTAFFSRRQPKYPSKL
jgi:enoyl-CoA hydratase